jgi:DNA-binding beta-propeller fold protein YncE
MLEAGIQDQGKRLHQEVDTAIKREIALARNMRSEDMAIMKDSVSQIEILRTSLLQEIEKNKKIVKSGDHSKVISFRSAVEKFTSMPPRPALSKPVFKASEIKRNTIKQQLGEIQSSPKSETPGYQIERSQVKGERLLKEAKVVAEVETGCEELWRIAFHHPEHLWCSGNDSSMEKIDFKGSILQELETSCECQPQDISVSPDGALFYTDVDSDSVYVVQNEKNKLSLQLSQWKPWGIFACSIDNILVALKNASYTEAKVVRYIKGREKQTIQFDDVGQALYSPQRNLMFVAENQKNNDVIVSDKAAKQIVVVNKSGKFRFRYPEKKSFTPRCVATDTRGRILITDGESNRIHVVDADGKSMSYIDNCSLDVPVSITIDNDNVLWVGEFFSGKIKGIQYLQ